MVVGRTAASNPTSTSIFRRGVSDSAAIRRYNSKEDDENIQRDASDKSSYGDAFFVVDMENDACEEVSHLSDPTGYELTTPRLVKIHRKPFSAHKQPHHGKRRLSATSLLKKPIAALVKHNYFGNHHKKSIQLAQQRQQKQQQTYYQKRSSKNKSEVSPVVEGISKASPASSNQERVPLTLLVPLGGEDSNNATNYYGALDHHAVENRNPRSSPDQPRYMSRNPPETLQLYQDPTLSWEDDRLLLFDDSTTPRTPLGLGASFQRQQPKKSATNLSVPDLTLASNGDATKKVQTTTTSAKLHSILCCRKNVLNEPSDRSSRNNMSHVLVHRWEIVTLILSALLLLLATALGVSPTTQQSSFVDRVFWAVTSFTTIGPATALQENGTVSISLMLLTLLYAMLGITTLGVVWGRYSTSLVREQRHTRTQEQDDRQRQVVSMFCGPPSHRGNAVTPFRKTLPSSTSRPSIWKVAGSVSVIWVLTILLGVTLDGDLTLALQYIFISACTLGDSSMATQSPMSKVLLLILIPLMMFGILRWLTTVADWTAKNGETKSEKEKMTTSELMNVMHALQLEDGLLTRADFLEILLLSMKKVDAELIVSLREGFQKATHSGSLDLTRAQLVETAMSALANE